MKQLHQLSIFLILCTIGELFSSLTGDFIPGNVSAMILMFALLASKCVKLHHVEQTGDFFLKNMGLFYLPGCISVMTVFTEMPHVFMPVIIICIVTTILVGVVTGYAVTLTIKLQNYIKSKFKETA